MSTITCRGLSACRLYTFLAHVHVRYMSSVAEIMYESIVFCSARTMSSLRKFTFAISFPDVFLVSKSCHRSPLVIDFTVFCNKRFLCIEKCSRVTAAFVEVTVDTAHCVTRAVHYYPPKRRQLAN